MGTISSFIERAFLKSSEVWALEVHSTENLTPHMKRIVFSAKDVARFYTNENIHVRLVLPPAHLRRRDWAPVDGEGRLNAGPVVPIYRKYTIRAIDVPNGRITMDFVVHKAAGPGSDWARAAQPGDVVGVIGPGGRSVEPAGWYLIAGDEAALPAIGRICEMLPRPAKGAVFVEVDGAGDEQKLDVPPDMSLTWLHRNGKSPGSTSLLMDAVKAEAWPDPETDVFAWVAAEAGTAKRIRVFLKTQRKLDKDRQLVVAYWTRS